MLDIREVLAIAEEYAYVGISELESRLIKTHGQPLWNLISLIHPKQETV